MMRGRKDYFMKKQPELTALTKKALIDTYFDITAKGQRATVGAIAEQAGYNRCTFYRYFTDTEQLLNQVETEICDAFQAALVHVSFDVSSEIIESLAAVYQQYGGYLSVLLGENGDARFAKRMKAIVSPVAKRRFAGDCDSEITAELKTELALSAVLAVVTKWYDMNQPITVAQLGMLIKDTLGFGGSAAEPANNLTLSGA